MADMGDRIDERQLNVVFDILWHIGDNGRDCVVQGIAGRDCVNFSSGQERSVSRVPRASSSSTCR